MLLAASWSQAAEWYDEVPKEFQGIWVQTSDDITAGLEKADIVTIRAKSISGAYMPDEVNDEVQRYSWPVRKVSRAGWFDRWLDGGGDGVIIFGGEPSEDHIAKIRIRVVLEPSKRFCRIYDVYQTGYNKQDQEWLRGRFVWKPL